MTKQILIEHDKSGFKEYLFQTIYKPNLKPSPLKSLEACEAQARKEINDSYNEYVTQLVDGMDLFLARVKEDEKETFDAIMKKSEEENPDNPFPINFQDALFLAKIAGRELAANQNENASLMYRWIIAFQPAFGAAWVGSAIAEQQMDHIQQAKDIFTLGLELLPNDYYLKRYAAEFYITIKDNATAKSIVETGIAQLKKDGKENTDDFRNLQNLLSQIR